jgi:hypothetical protein
MSCRIFHRVFMSDLCRYRLGRAVWSSDPPSEHRGGPAENAAGSDDHRSVRKHGSATPRGAMASSALFACNRADRGGADPWTIARKAPPAEIPNGEEKDSNARARSAGMTWINAPAQTAKARSSTFGGARVGLSSAGPAG